MLQLTEADLIQDEQGHFWRRGHVPKSVTQTAPAVEIDDSLVRAIRGAGTGTRSTHIQPETALQIAVIEWLRRYLPDVAAVTFANLGGMKLSPASAKLQKAIGYQSGTPDLFLAYPINGKSGLFLELKTETGRASVEQVSMIERLRQHGFCAEIVYGFDATVKAIQKYFNTQ